MIKIKLHIVATLDNKDVNLEDLLNNMLKKLEEKDKEIDRLKNKLKELKEGNK